MAATATAISAAEAERQELRGLLHKKYRWLDYKFDLVFWVTAAFVVGAAADITKLLVHRRARRRGVGRALMEAIEARAREAGFTLLTLDTVRGDPAEQLYTTAGWQTTQRRSSRSNE